MQDDTTEGSEALVLRDVEGNFYVLDEKTIRACRATPEQEATLRDALPEQEDVSGFIFPNAAGIAGQLFWVSQGETRETGAPAPNGFRGPVRVTGIFEATIAPADFGPRR